MSALRLSVLFALAFTLAVPGTAVGKRKPPPPPPPPPDSAADCSFVVEPSIDDYIVLATLLVGVRCDTTKQRIDVSATQFTRDGVSVSMLPAGAESRTCFGTNACFVAFDLFSYDNHPVAFPGDQLYCATGSGVVGGRVVGPGSGCELDARI
jgi:hypothetical protein